jgi:hypothetical protein
MNHLTSELQDPRIFCDSKGDWNHDIHIRDIEEEDFYNGITVQSYGNTECIYELRFINKNWFYKPIANIKNRIYGKLDSEMLTYNGSWHRFERKFQKEQWSETHYSILLNKMIRRDKLLNELLNEI